ncbi:MAG: hypothetical protein EHM35_08395 [Planctomycetaceae bacterium]|nr:MAG: hypothetical protein EHM35_08395 [Planctomycetaceae bacterium]
MAFQAINYGALVQAIHDEIANHGTSSRFAAWIDEIGAYDVDEIAAAVMNGEVDMDLTGIAMDV